MWHKKSRSLLFSPITPELLTIKYRRCQSLAGKVLAIRREDSSVWERRAPLSPTNVRQLTKQGVKVLVQPSNRRAYPMQAYANAGAIIQEDISEAPVIIGVKQVPIDSLIPHKTYCFFSHTIKAQEANMPLLDAILEKNIRLIDYEKLVDEKGQRVVAFGVWAGVAGMINILHGLGLRLLALGHHTPFMHIGPAHNYRNTGMARQVIRDSGYEIALGMMPKSIGPLTFVITGSGNVSQGAQEIFQEFPHEFIPPEMLQKVSEHGSDTKLYGCSVSRADHLVRKDGGPFDPQEYDEHPELYYSTFSKKIAPYASVIVNGIYWAPNSPRLITIPDAKYLLRPASTPWLPTSVGAPPLPHRLLAICDISADPGGSIEFMTECTTIDTPFCLYDADQHQNTESKKLDSRFPEKSSVSQSKFKRTRKYRFAGPGVLVCSIDNMPTQLPREATDFFGDLLSDHMPTILMSDASRPLEQEKFTPIIQNAIIASNGQLTRNFQYITDLRATSTAKPVVGEPRQKVLVLGAGYVSAPTVEYLTRDSGTYVTIASALKDEADVLAKKFSNTESILLDVVDRPDLMEDLIKNVDIVISLLPYALHPKVAEQCIKHKTHMVTASYLSPHMKELHEAAVDAGITIVNEVGLDPGIDHLLAMECFDNVHMNGGKVKSFVSFCGGLPAPECSNNPLRYKFSWSPRGVLNNVLSPASYLKDGKVIEIAAGTLLDQVSAMDFLPGFNLEGFPNRNSIVYSDLYNIKDATTVVRGTLRFQGFSDAMKSLHAIGLLDMTPHPSLHPKGPEVTWRQLMCILLGIHDHNIFLGNLKSAIFERVGKKESRADVIQNLGLLSEDPVIKKSTPLDTISHYLAKRLQFESGERDLIILHHEIGIQWPDLKMEKRCIDLVCYGNPDGYSAMAKTVGYPAGIATKMVLEGEIQRRGMVIPMSQEIYMPMLKRLKQEGIKSIEYSTFSQ